MRRAFWSSLALVPALGLAMAVSPAVGASTTRTSTTHTSTSLDARAAAAARIALTHMTVEHMTNQRVPGHAQRVRGLTQQFSYNWSGYADDNTTGHTYRKVSGKWAEPAITCGKEDQIAVFWVGIDGWNSSTVEQGGTLAQCFEGTAHYYTWWEMYPGVLEVLQAGEAAKAFAAFLDPEVGIERVEGVAVHVGEPDAVVLDFKAADFWETAIQLGLAAPLHADLDSSIRPAGFVNRLNGVNDHLDDRRVDGGASPNVLDRSPDIDVAHLGISPAFPFIFLQLSAGSTSSPQTRARVAWIFFSKRAISSRLAATSACSASISATMVCCVARGGRGISIAR